MNRRARVILGTIGILVGLSGLVNILRERREAEQRRRVLSTLAEDFRKRHDPSAVVWEGRAFRPGDRVRIAKWTGLFEPADTGANVSVQAAHRQVGIVIRGEQRRSDYTRIDPAEPIQIVRVRWLPQKWRVAGSDRWIDLPQFEATIHVSHLQQE